MHVGRSCAWVALFSSNFNDCVCTCPHLASALHASALERAWLCAEISAKIGNPCSPLDRHAQENVSLVRGLAVFMGPAFI